MDPVLSFCVPDIPVETDLSAVDPAPTLTGVDGDRIILNHVSAEGNPVILKSKTILLVADVGVIVIDALATDVQT
tara:strand:- start:62 stop:286 length:225 start_codon:yes stop_codon:yes gene_type:complete